jgi:hypothetical protein
MEHWTRRITRTVRYLVGVPSLVPLAAASQPVPWLAAMRSAVICISLGAALFGAFLVHDDPGVRPLDLHALWGFGAWNGGVLSMFVLLYGRRPLAARYAAGAFWIGLIGFVAGMFIGRSVTDSSPGLWPQLGVAAGIGVVVVMVAVAVTHLPPRRQISDVPDPKATGVQA